ncbi:hypothetical protein Ocin01_16812 [Orchesella cincta]|uniref:Uncharacterized protein n=1 Tax=Orchesella cincta TaxID=48709 RepID=A0A1D2MA73_ORCCI|nr:hypothetical protein Ocin01_16812 [Orchesella cincta]
MKPIRVTLLVVVILMLSTVTLCQRKSKSKPKSRSKTPKPKVPSDDELVISPRAVQPDAYVILVPVPNAGGNGGPPSAAYGVPSAPGSSYGAPSAPVTSYGPPAQRNRAIPTPGNEISPASLDGKQEFIVTKDGIGLLVPGRSTGGRSPRPSAGNSGPTAATLPGGHSVRVASQNGKLGFLVTRDLIPNLAPGTFTTTSGVARTPGAQGQVSGGSPATSALPGGSGIRIGSQNGQLGLLVPRDQLSNLGPGLIPSNPGSSSSSQGQTQIRAPPTFQNSFPGAESLPTVFGPDFGPGSFLGNSEFGQSSGPSSDEGFRPIFTPRRPSPPRQREEFGFPRSTSPNENGPFQRATEVFTYLFNNQDTAPQLVFKDRRIL